LKRRNKTRVVDGLDDRPGVDRDGILPVLNRWMPMLGCRNAQMRRDMLDQVLALASRKREIPFQPFEQPLVLRPTGVGVAIAQLADPLTHGFQLAPFVRKHDDLSRKTSRFSFPLVASTLIIPCFIAFRRAAPGGSASRS